MEDTESALHEYQIQLEQVEIALKSQPDNDELLKLKADLEVNIKKSNIFQILIEFFYRKL